MYLALVAPRGLQEEKQNLFEFFVFHAPFIRETTTSWGWWRQVNTPNRKFTGVFVPLQAVLWMTTFEDLPSPPEGSGA